MIESFMPDARQLASPVNFPQNVHNELQLSVLAATSSVGEQWKERERELGIQTLQLQLDIRTTRACRRAVVMS